MLLAITLSEFCITANTFSLVSKVEHLCLFGYQRQMRHGRGLVQRWLAGCWLWFEHLMKSFCTHCHWLVGWLGKSDLGQLPPPSDPAHQQHILPNYRGFASLRTIKLSPPTISLWRLNSDSMTNCRDWGRQPGDVDLDKFTIDCSCPLF